MRSIRTLLLMSFAGLAVLGGAPVLLAMARLTSAMDELEAGLSRARRMSHSQGQLQQALQQRQDALVGQLRAAGDRGALETKRRADATYAQEVKRLSTLTADEEARRLIGELGQLDEARTRPAEARILALQNEGRTDDALARFWGEYLPARRAQMQTFLELEERLNAEGSEGQQALQRELHGARRLALGATFLAVLLAGGLSLLLARRLVSPVLAMTQAARCASQGDFSVRLPDSGNADEVGELSRSLNGLYAFLQEFTGSLEETVRTLRSALQTLTGSAEVQRGDSLRHAASLEQVVKKASEIQLASQRTAEQLQDSLRAVGELSGLAERTSASATTSLESFAAILTQVEAMAGQVQALEGSARSIQEVAGTVKDLADQSNVLALNAALEAVRSGESGRGFAAVARQMRGLANESVQATLRIREMLEQTALGIQRTTAMAHGGKQHIASGLADARGAGQELQRIGVLLGDVTASVGHINSAVRQQEEGISQIFHAVRDQEGLMVRAQEQLGRTGEALSAVDEAAGRVEGVLRRLRDGRLGPLRG